MRQPRVRFTVRRIMIAVAMVVPLLPLSAGVVWLRSPEQVRLRSVINGYNLKATYHAELELEFARLSKYQDFFKSHGTAFRGGQIIHFPVGQRPELISKDLELAKYHGALRRKYEDAARHPSLPVEPDPPPP